MAKRKKYDTEFKRTVVARVLAGKSSGEETIPTIAKDIKVPEGNIRNWVKAAAGPARAKPARKKKRSKKKARAAGIRQGKARPLRVVTEAIKTPSLNDAIASAGVLLAELQAVRDAYRRMFGGAQ